MKTLASLGKQTYPKDRFGVIVVDDGSTEDTPTIAHQQFPFAFRYVRQKNQWATAARNYWASLSQAEILVFVDDDVTVSMQTLEALVEMCCQTANVVGIGTLIRRSIRKDSVYTAIMEDPLEHAQTVVDEVDVQFVDCNTELMACKRSDFFELGMLQDPTQGRGWPNWDDVDFEFRAHQNGFRLLQRKKRSGNTGIIRWLIRTKPASDGIEPPGRRYGYLENTLNFSPISPCSTTKLPLLGGRIRLCSFRSNWRDL